MILRSKEPHPKVRCSTERMCVCVCNCVSGTNDKTNCADSFFTQCCLCFPTFLYDPSYIEPNIFGPDNANEHIGAYPCAGEIDAEASWPTNTENSAAESESFRFELLYGVKVAVFI